MNISSKNKRKRMLLKKDQEEWEWVLTTIQRRKKLIKL
jgi:hypothetical protein